MVKVVFIINELSFSKKNRDRLTDTLERTRDTDEERESEYHLENSMEPTRRLKVAPMKGGTQLDEI